MYAKIFSQIFNSSIADDYRVRHLFMDLLALSDQEGIVDMTHEAISARTRVPLEEVKAAIAKLELPDERSRSREHEGRRLVRLDDHRDWGWMIVNYLRYREMKSETDRKEYLRNYMVEYRKRHKGKSLKDKPNGENVNRKSLREFTPVNDVNRSPSVCVVQGSDSTKGGTGENGADPIDAFNRFWEAYPKKACRYDAEHAFMEIGAFNHIERILQAIKEQCETPGWKKDGGQFIPLPSNWLRGARWQDEVKVPGTEPAGHRKPKIPPGIQMKAIEEEIECHPANRESAFYDPKATPQQREHLKFMRERLRSLRSQIANA